MTKKKKKSTVLLKTKMSDMTQPLTTRRWPWEGSGGTMLGGTAGERRSMIPFKAMSPGGVDTDLDSSLHEPLQ